MADAVIYLDSEGVIVLWNDAAAMLFGYGAAEAIGQPIDLIIPEHLRAAHWRGFRRAMAAGALTLQGRPTLTRAKHRSGRKLYVEMTFAVVKSADDAVRGSVAVARDVTERVEQQPAATRKPNVGDA
jgi:PAS domain S-box-containing protein